MPSNRDQLLEWDLCRGLADKASWDPRNNPPTAHRAPPHPLKLQPACDKTFAQVAAETGGLTILKTMLSQPQYAAALPSPAYDYTVFAPSDNAFFAFLAAFSEAEARRGAACVVLPLQSASRGHARSPPAGSMWRRQCSLLCRLSIVDRCLPLPVPPSLEADLSITDALALGDRLNSVLLYHVVPGALTPDQLAKRKQPPLLPCDFSHASPSSSDLLAVHAFGMCAPGPHLAAAGPASTGSRPRPHSLPIPPACTADAAAETQLTTGLAIKTNNGEFTLGVANADGAVSSRCLLAGLGSARLVPAWDMNLSEAVRQVLSFCPGPLPPCCSSFVESRPPVPTS